MLLLGFLTCTMMFVLSALLWLRMKEIPRLEEMTTEPLASPPSVSIIIAACNEAETIEPALRRLLADRSENWDVIVVEDRSTDGTRAIVEAMVTEVGEGLRMVPVDDLPEGWLGKVHALHQGSRVADGDWLLFSDADIHIDGDLLRRAIAFSETSGLDHLALLPRLSSKTFLARIVIAAFVGIFAVSSSRQRRQDPGNREHGLGVGAFNLCRRSVFDRSEGFEWLRLDVADDLALGLAMKRAGARHEVMVATEGLEVEWYADLPSMIRGLEKNSFGAVCHYSYFRAFALVTGLFLWVLGPLACLPSYPFLCFSAYAAMAGVGLLGASHLKWDRAPFLFTPIGIFLIAVIIVNSAWSAWRRGHVRWRGTTYAVADLKDRQVLRF